MSSIFKPTALTTFSKVIMMNSPRITWRGFLILFSLLAFCTVTPVWPVFAENEENPIEIGDVKWGRNLEAAIQKSYDTSIPVFALFQEVPGCLGCKTFGHEVLSHPLLVEAIEDEFIPVLILNNRPGTRDEQWLRDFGEPAWNYQVIRFLDGTGEDIIPRKEKVWDIGGVAARMVETLRKSSRPVPKYLRAVMLEHDRANQASIALATACFWSGERTMGKHRGVVTTEAGYYHSREVTLLNFHHDLVGFEELVDYAAQQRCAQKVYVGEGVQWSGGISALPVERFERHTYTRAPADGQKKDLQNWAGLNRISYISPMQLTKINSTLIDNQQKALLWLSPRQKLQLLRP